MFSYYVGRVHQKLIYYWGCVIKKPCSGIICTVVYSEGMFALWIENTK